MKLDKVTRLFVLSTVGLLLFWVDAWLQLLGGLGLSLTVTIFALWYLGVRDSLWITVIWIFFGSLFFGEFGELLFTGAGGLLAFATVACLRPILKETQIWILGCLGASAFQLGKLLVAVFLAKEISYMLYFPFFMFFGVLLGSFLGLCTQFLINKGNNLWKTIFK